MNILQLAAEYTSGRTTPCEIVMGILDRILAEGEKPVWISLVPRELILARAQALNDLPTAERQKLPLFGIPFATKDNIDVANIPTTAGCPAFAYTPTQNATVITRLEAAGAILIGKTNMDQFATGLVGTRSPFGAPSSVFNKEYISGGSSSGSAVAVASGLVAFSLGTDTAGSGRVPAMFNNLIGLKPTRGVVSAHGVVPACRSIDCVSIFTGTAAEAALVLACASAYDADDAYARQPALGAGAAPWAAAIDADGRPGFRFGVPAAAQLEYFGDPHNGRLFQAAIAAFEKIGGEPVEIDLAPLLEAARLLYQGPWIAERTAFLKDFLAEHRDVMDPTVAQIIGGGERFSAVEAFDAAYALESVRQSTNQLWKTIDVMLLPTAPRTYTHAEIADAPVERNSHLGFYTNFVNLLDLAAVATPAGMRPDDLPFGVSLIGPAFSESGLLLLADRLQREIGGSIGGSADPLSGSAALSAPSVPPSTLLMAVVGAHLSGQPLNWQLTQRGGRLVRLCRTAPDYRLYALADTVPAKPGLVRVPGFKGSGIELEVWALPADSVGGFIDGVPQPLTIGKVRLEDGSLVMGFLAEPIAVEEAQEITHLGGWRSYLATLKH